jgi:hypothetical protein
VVRSGEFVFGTYLTHQIAPTCSWTGSPACYLFTTSLDLKLPYHGKLPADDGRAAAGSGGGGSGAVDEDNSVSMVAVGQQTTGSSTLQPSAFYAQSDQLFVGNGDFSLDSDLCRGSCDVEHCFGVGMQAGSPEAGCLLAGSPLFVIDDLEVWAVLSS